MSKIIGRGARLTALALATGTLIVAATGQAGAAPVPVPDVFGGVAQAASLKIQINLPAAIPTSVPILGGISSLEQTISFVDGNTAKGLTPQVSVAKAVLGNGNIVAISDLLGLSVESSLGGKTSDSDALLAQNIAGLLDVGVGQITSSVAPDSATSALTSSSTSSLLSLKVGLGGLNLPVKADLQEVLDTLSDTVDGAQGTVTQTIDSALATLDQATQGATAPVTEQINAVKTELTNLLDGLQDTLLNLDADANIVDLGLLKSTENITRAGSMVTAKATSEVGGLNILNGLVKVDAVKTESFSSANGSKGSAAADTLTTILGLKVSDVLDLKLTSDGLSGTINGNELPDVAKDAVSTVIDAVNGVLALAGVEIENAETTSEFDPNGKWANSSSSGVGIIVNPLHATKALVEVRLVPAGTAVNADVLAKRTVCSSNCSKITKQTPLARTGADLPLVAVIGTGLVGAAMVARRRRRFVEA